MSPIFAVLFFAMVASAVPFNEDNTRIIPPSERSPERANCGHFGRWSGCASKCPPKCSTRDIQSQMYCIDVCVEGCRCNPGYILEDDSGLCVLPESCKSPEEYKKKPAEEVTPHCTGYCT